MCPPGASLLVTWHEPTGVVETLVTVKAKEETRITVELKP